MTIYAMCSRCASVVPTDVIKLNNGLCNMCWAQVSTKPKTELSAISDCKVEQKPSESTVKLTWQCRLAAKQMANRGVAIKQAISVLNLRTEDEVKEVEAIYTEYFRARPK